MTKTSDKLKQEEKTRTTKPAKKPIYMMVKPRLFKFDASCYGHKLFEDQDSK